ncbi:MAG: PTS sugar transporter subunit IIA [Hyphomonadaceae bacterium]
MSELRSLILPEAVFTRLPAATRKQAIQMLCAPLARAARLDAQAVCEAVLRRERLGPSGLGEGVALPHAQIAGLDRPLAAFGRLEQPADFRALDGRPADLVFLLISPGGPGHLKALAALARFARRAPAREALRAAPDSEALAELLALDRAAA